MKTDSRVLLCGLALIFAACGDETTQINQTGLDVFASEDDLPECTGSNEGELAFVKGETSTRICVDGEWLSTGDTVYVSGDRDTIIVAGDTIFMQGDKDTVYVKDNDFSCTTKELADSSGLKIICNGDSIGVVLNGAKGDKGEDGLNGTKGDSGAGCTLKDRTDTTVTVTCGDSTMVIQLGHAADGDTMTVNLESLVGYTQKGPFLKGSSVYLYELNGSLNQTNGNFTSVIADDDGRYRFRTRGLKYPYAMIVVDGYYRNEVTGVTSDAPIRLRAITDVSSRVTGSANVNLLTHLEFDRVNSLATGPGKLKLKEAKHKAQTEILSAFGIDTNLVKNVQSEDMDVFGESEADAALLAISVLLQGDGNAADLSVRLTELADDLVDGKWDGGNSATLKAQLADWIAEADAEGRLGKFRSNVRGWNLSDTVPVFEKFVRNFYSRVSELGKCGSEEIPVGTVKNVKNPKSKYYANEYTDAANRARFICVNADSARWRLATEIEKDTAGLGHEYEDGAVTLGKVNSEFVYVYENNNWRHGTALDTVVGEGCMPNSRDIVVKGKDSTWYKCIGDSSMVFSHNDLIEASWEGAWRKASVLETDTNGLGHNFEDGDIHRGQVNEDNVYVYENNNWVAGTLMDETVGTGCVKSLDGKIVNGLDNKRYLCSIDYTNGIARTWSLAPDIMLDTAGWGAIGGWKNGDVRNGTVNKDQPYVFQNGAWRVGTKLDSLLQQGCVTPGDTSIRAYNMFYYVCKDNSTWEEAPAIYNDTKVYRENCRNGAYSDGRLVSGKLHVSLRYVCENGEFRNATALEYLANIACVASTRNYIYKTGNTFSKCLADGFSTAATKDRGIMKDRAGKVYETVVIGTQQWMAENLNYVTDSSFCYNNEETNCNAFGRLYSRVESQTICPTGWHLPSRDEWATLFSVAGCSDFVSKNRCDDVGYVLKSTGGWTASTSTLNGADTYGFTVLPAGVSYYIKAVQDGKILIDRQDSREIRNYSKFWTYEAGVTLPYTSSIVFDRNYVVALVNDWDPGSYSSNGYSESRSRYRQSVRCIQD